MKYSTLQSTYELRNFNCISFINYYKSAEYILRNFKRLYKKNKTKKWLTYGDVLKSVWYSVKMHINILINRSIYSIGNYVLN